MHETISNSRKEFLTVLPELMALACSFIDMVRMLAYVFLLTMTLLWIVPELRLKKIYDEHSRSREQQDD